MLNRISQRLRKGMEAALRPGTHISYSQCGEDLIVSFLFGIKGMTQPTYLDIGAHHPFRLSNTALFHARGSRGINVEANPSLHGLFERHRPNDTNLNVGVGSEEGELDFFVMKDDSLSTFSSGEAAKLQAFGQTLDHKARISVVTVRRLLNEYNHGTFPDFLSIDIEGKDFEVLRTIDYDRVAPKVICVEAAMYAPTGICPRNDELIDYLLAKGYVEYANTRLNAIFAQQMFFA